MKALIESVKKMSLRYKQAPHTISFLDNACEDPRFQRMIKQMNGLSLNQLGINGSDDPYHFEKDLNKIIIEGTEDYRLVLFFIKKGTKMPIHDHPNMCVFFRLMFGRL